MAALASTPTSCAGDTVTQHTGLTHPSRSLPLSLRGLPVAARALMVGAHPDDEDSALLAELVLRHGVRTAYLSLTRGEGGQNCLGPESGAASGCCAPANYWLPVNTTAPSSCSRRASISATPSAPRMPLPTGRASAWWAASCRPSAHCSPTW